MKNLILTLALLTLLSSAFAKKVKFAVDMTGQTVNTTGVHISGDFQQAAGYPGGNWNSGSTLMENEPGTEIYSVVVDIPADAKYEFKFINGDLWYEVEFVPVESRVGYDFIDNRWIWIDSLWNDTVMVGPILYAGNAPAGKNLVRFKVDISILTFIDPSGVHIAGDFQDWDPAYTRMYCFDGISYEYIAYVDNTIPGWQYKFLNGNTVNAYEDVPDECSVDGNRSVTVTGDIVLDPVCFDLCTLCPTGIQESDPEWVVRVYPNPADEQVTLDFNDMATYHDVVITDVLGNIVRTFSHSDSGILRISTADLKEGIYFIRVRNDLEWISTLKVAITH